MSDTNTTELPKDLEANNEENIKLIEQLLSKDEVTKEEIYQVLEKVDPIIAKARHPNDERRNRRSLEIYLNNKIPQSRIIENQKSLGKKQSFRYRTCCFWLYSEQNILNERLDKRVDEMIQRGLFEEIKEMKKYYDILNKDNNQDNLYTRGIFQAIGFKEFDDYLKQLNENDGNEDIDNPNNYHHHSITSKESLEKLKNSGIEKMKNATRRYSRKQISWIKNKILPRFTEEESLDPHQARLYILDISDVNQWNESVTKISHNVLKSFIKKEDTPDPRNINPAAKEIYGEVEMPVDPRHSHGSNSNDVAQLRKRQHAGPWEKYECEVCSVIVDDGNGTGTGKKKKPRILNGLVEWEQHKKSRLHRQNVKRQRKAKEKEKAREKAREQEGKKGEGEGKEGKE